MADEGWFGVHEINDHLWIIREPLDRIDPRFYTSYTNLYLLIGDHTALLIDTGSGYGDLKSVVDALIGDRLLLVINTHNHFDHVGGNRKFAETRIHRQDFKKLMYPMDVSFLKGCKQEFETYFEQNDWKLHFAKENIPLIGNEIYQLGNLEVKVFHTPGHTPGSICLKTNFGEYFTGDTLHYGAVFLPGSDQFPFYLDSLIDLGSQIKDFPELKIFPGHEQYGAGLELYDLFMDGLHRHDQFPSEYDPFLEAKVYRTSKFRFIQPVEVAKT